MKLNEIEQKKLELSIENDDPSYIEYLLEQEKIDDLNKVLLIFDQKITLMKYCLINNKEIIIHYLLNKGISLAQYYTLHEEHPLVNLVVNDNIEQLKLALNLTSNEKLNFDADNLHQALDYAFMFGKVPAIEILLSQKQIKDNLTFSQATLGIIDVSSLIYLINKYHYPEFLLFVKREIKTNSSFFALNEIHEINQALQVFEEKKYLENLLNHNSLDKEIIKI